MRGERVYSGSSFEDRAGYARAVIDGEWVFVSGTTGFDYATATIADTAAAQTERCFVNIAAALAEAGASLADLVRIRVYVADRADLETILPVVGRHCREARPANTTVIAQLVDPRMKVEIEVTAKRTSA